MNPPASIKSPLESNTGSSGQVAPTNPSVSEVETSLAAEFAAGWQQIYQGVALAGGIYPVAIAAIYLSLGVLSVMQRPSGDAWELSFPILAAGLWCTAVLIATGMLWAAVVSIGVFPIVYLITRSLGLRGNIISLGAFCGGLVGFAAVLPFVMLILVNEHLEGVWAVAALLALGPGLTTVLGQLGGAWGAKRAGRSGEKWYQQQLEIAAVSSNAAPAQEKSFISNGDEHTRSRFRFDIRQLMWVAAWLSVLLSFIRLSGIPFPYILPLLAGWLLYQAVTLWLGQRLLRYWFRRSFLKRPPKIRST